MKNLVLTLLVLAAAAPGAIPGPEQYEAKWTLPGLAPPAFPAESSHSYDVRHYRIDLDLPMTDGSMTARCAIRLRSNRPALDSIFLDFANLTCDSVKLGDAQLEFQDSWLFLNVFLDPPVPEGDSVTIDVFYRRNAGTSNRGFYWYAKDPGQQRLHSVAYSITQPNDSRYWFPGWDHPWDKAEAGCMVSVTVPDSFVACAPGLLDSVTTRGGKRTFWWTHRYPVSTYLINFAASSYVAQVQHAHIGGGDSIPVYNYVWPEDTAARNQAYRNVPDMIEFFSRPDRFGPYPFPEEKYGHVAVYPFSFGGMEHQTMTTVHRAWVLNAAEWGIAHELAHMWFGDYVTCRDWREIWLNEGSATYLDPLWFHHSQGRAVFNDRMADYARAYFRSDSSLRRPLFDPPMQYLFDWGHTYCKAAWVNHMTRYLFRDTILESPGLWFEAERAYLDSFAYGTATTEGRRQVYERLTGLDLGWFYDEWVFQAGFPNYTVNWFGREDGEDWEIVLDIGQVNGAQAPEFFRTPVEIRVTHDAGDTLLFFEIGGNPHREVVSLPAEPTGIVFDPGRWLLHQSSITSGVADALAPEAGVTRPVLHAPVPSPARNRTALRFSLPSSRVIRLTVHDAVGRLVRSLDSGRFPAGHHDRVWDLRDYAGLRVPAGAYLIRLDAGTATETRKVVVR